MNIFEQATRVKVLFESAKGHLLVRDLWDLPLTSNTGKANLDSIAIALNKQLKNADTVSFVEAEKKSDEIVQLKFDIVRHIIDVKIAENKIRAEQVERSQKKQRVLAILADRKDKQLETASDDDLQKLLAELA